MFAGHESTSNTISWAIYELAMNPQIQARMRDEVRGVRATITARGDVDYKPADLDAMPYTTAIMKVRSSFTPLFA
jgi:cytochrome P450